MMTVPIFASLAAFLGFGGSKPPPPPQPPPPAIVYANPAKVVDVRGGEAPGCPASRAVDGDWRTGWSSAPPGAAGFANLPHWLTLDLGEEKPVYGFVCLPQPYNAAGWIKQYEVFVSRDGKTWGTPVAQGAFDKFGASYWAEVHERFATVMWPQPVSGRYVKFVALSAHDGRQSSSLAELAVITNPDDYPFKHTTLAHLKGMRMSPSIHLGYDIPPATKIFYLEGKVEQSAPGSYFMMIGWNNGYCGLQEQGGGKKVAIFSVWDAELLNEKPEHRHLRQAKVVWHDKDVRTGRFGGEGTGYQSFFDFDWKLGETYKFIVTAEPHGDWTWYSGYLYQKGTSLMDSGNWKKLVVMATINPSGTLRGCHSFVEDFRRDFDSFNQIRRAQYSNMWAYAADNQWHASSRAYFTVDGNPNRNIDAGAVPGGFFMVSGAGTKNQTVKVWSAAVLEKPNATPPKNLPVDVYKLMEIPQKKEKKRFLFW